MFVNFFSNQVTNVGVLNTVGAIPQTTNFAGQTRISLTFDEPKTTQILAFEIINAEEAIVIEISTKDFNSELKTLAYIKES